MDFDMPKKQPDDEKQSAAEVLSLLLRERLHRMTDGTYNHANTRHLRELCSILLLKHSEASGKHQGCRFWSQGATGSFQKHGSRGHRQETVRWRSPPSRTSISARPAHGQAFFTRWSIADGNPWSP